MAEANWNDPNARCMGVLLDGRAQETGIRRVGSDSTLLLIVNSHSDGVPFKLSRAVGGTRWVRLIDTNQVSNGEMPEFEFGHEYVVTGRSLLLFVLRPERTHHRSTAAERSFQRVVQTLEDASSRHVDFGFEFKPKETKPVPPAAPQRRGRVPK